MKRHGKPRIRGFLIAALVLLALGFAAAALPTAALATGPARYVLEKCDWQLPGGGVEGANFHGSPPYTGAIDCYHSGGSIFVVQQGDAGRSAGYWSLPMPAPPGGYLESITVTGSMCNGANADADSVVWAVRPGWPLNCSAQTHTFVINSPEGDPGLVYVGCEGSCLGSPEAWASNFAAIEVDPVPPKVESIAGTIAAGAALHGHQVVTAAASDQGGGVAALTLRVNGQPLEPSRTFNCGGTWVSNASYVGVVVTHATPCPPKAQGEWTVDTSTFPFQEGTNTISVCAQDFSTIGSANEGCLTQNVSVDNSCAESAVVGGEVLNARFRRSDSDTITVPYGSGARIGGRLSDTSGKPIPGATICIGAKTQGAYGNAQPLATATTDSAGLFSYKLAAGPNRRVVLGYRHDAFQINQTISYRAHARPRLKISPTRIRPGGRIRISGWLPGPRAAGRVLILQASALHGRWLTFHRATTAANGHFHAAYRFGSSSNVTYRIRAVSPRQRGYPYDPGHSRRALVSVGG